MSETDRTAIEAGGDDLECAHYMERLIDVQEEDAAPFPAPQEAEPLPDRLVDFARDEMHQLIDDFEALRYELGVSRAGSARRLAAWRERLIQHLCWEMAGPVAEFARRSPHPGCDGVTEHAAEHRTLMRQIDELVLGAEAGESAHIRDFCDRLEITLADHRDHEVDEICYPLDHTLDNPTIEALEKLLHAA